MLLRRALVPLLVLLACVAVFVANLAVWSWSRIGDTDNFVDTVGPLAENPEVVDGVATELTQRIQDRIPAAPEGIVHDVVKGALETQTFRDIWTEEIRRSHRKFLDSVDSGSDEIRLDLGPLLTRADEELQSVGLSGLTEHIEGIDDITVWRSERVRQVSRAVQINDWLAVLMPPVAIALIVAALLLSTRTWHTAAAIGIGVALAMVVTAVMAWFARRELFDRMRNDLERAAAHEVWDTTTESLWRQIVVLFVAGIGVALVAGIFATRRPAPRARAS